MNSRRQKQADLFDDPRLCDLFQTALDLKAKENYEDAAAAFKAIVNEYPECAAAQGLCGGILYSFLRKPTEALPFLTKAVRLAPKSETASLGLFNALWDLERRDEALSEIKRYQTLTDFRCQDYIDIVAEIDEKWPDKKPLRKKPKTRQEKQT